MHVHSIEHLVCSEVTCADAHQNGNDGQRGARDDDVAQVECGERHRRRYHKVASRLNSIGGGIEVGATAALDHAVQRGDTLLTQLLECPFGSSDVSLRASSLSSSHTASRAPVAREVVVGAAAVLRERNEPIRVRTWVLCWGLREFGLW